MAPAPSYAEVAQLLARAETAADRAQAARVLQRYYRGRAARRCSGEPARLCLVILQATCADVCRAHS